MNPAQQRTFISSFTITSGVLIGIAWIGLAYMVAGWLPSTNPDTLPSELSGATIGAIFLAFYFHLAHCRIIASPSELTIVQPFRNYVLPWEQVAGSFVGGTGKLYVNLADGGHIAVLCFSGSFATTLTGGHRAMNVRDTLNDLKAQALPHEPSRPATRRLTFDWKIPLLLWIFLLSASLIGWFLAPHHVLA